MAEGVPVVVFVTFPSMEVARNVSNELVVRGLAACVNLLPGAESIYRWQDRVESSAEVVGLVKTTAAKVEALKEQYLRLHPYEVAEFLTLDISGGSAAYLEWVRSSVGDDGNTVKA
jgi:periplasmic divalent cation tolerance protein